MMTVTNNAIQRRLERPAVFGLTLPGKHFDVGRRLRQLIVAALSRAGISSRPTATVDA
jgi:hypothetical protein